MFYYFSCPSCGSSRDFTASREEKSSTGFLLFFVGGLLPYLLYSSERSGRIQCGECGYIFRKPSMPSSPLSKFAFRIMIILVVGLCFTVFMVAAPPVGVYERLFEYGIANAMLQFVSENPEATAIGMAATFTMLFVLCTIVFLVANSREHKRIREDYYTHERLRR